MFSFIACSCFAKLSNILYVNFWHVFFDKQAKTMRSIKITDDAPQSKIIEVPKAIEEYDTVSLKSISTKREEKTYEDYSQDKKDKKYQTKFNFPSKYHYFVFLIMFQNSNEMIPIAVRHCITFSGGKFYKIADKKSIITELQEDFYCN